MKRTVDQQVIEKLLEADYWVIDILPRQVAANSAGQYPQVDSYFRQPSQLKKIRESFAQILLKLNCYHDLLVCEGESENWEKNVSPEELAKMLVSPEGNVCLNILVEGQNTLITFDSTDTCMAVYNPSSALRTLLQKLVTSQGLFFWQPPEGKKKSEEKLNEWRVM